MPHDLSAERRPAEPWLSFLTDLDAALDGPADFHCIGGFVVSQHYGFARETADLDVLTVIPPEAAERVAALAGKGSPLQRKHRVYIDHVGVANYPDDYETRLVRVFPIWPKVRLWALEPHDLALTKLERSNDRDIRDVMYLAQAGLIDEETLISRFEKELEPYITGRTPTWNRTTLKMWVEACWPR
ncbi:MAG: DUF6036 family nucleotidyltransferase [Acidobacteria bacterium]|nr:DUF6036 family nucleotidyltransferase [Acidobacteriota bacterium]